MRPSNKQRSRNKPSGNGSHNNPRRPMGNIVNRVFESAGPDGKVRGTPQQIIDKYQALARDAQVSGDRVAAESYLQHSEHYSRLLGEAQRQNMENRFSGGAEREDAGRGDDQPELSRPQPAPAPAHMPVAAGLTTIDTIDADDFGGPIETPEARRRAPVEERRSPVEEEPAPVAVAQPQAPPAEATNGGDRNAAPAQADAEAAPEAPKRGRPRRRARPDGGAPPAPQPE